MLARSTACLALLISGGQAVAQSAETARFAIDEYGWDLEQGTDRCVARAQLLAGDRPAQLELSTTSSFSTTRVAIVGKGLTGANGSASTRLYAGQTPTALSWARRFGAGADAQGAVFSLSLLPLEATETDAKASDPESNQRKRAEALAQSEGIYIDGLFTEAVVLETGSLANIMSRMDDCTDKLVAAWGFDAKQQRQLSRRANTTNPQDWTTRMVEAFGQGPRATSSNYVLDIILTIDEEGKVTECKVTPADAPVTSNDGCRMIRRYAKFDPALDGASHPVRSYAVVVVTSQELSGPR